jgi:WD40 repeat protein
VARLQHPNIVQIYEIGEQDGRPYFALEFLEGGSLSGTLRGTPQPARAAAQMVATLARAVHAAHGQNIVHRDLKPANVLLAADGTPKIADFGLAKQTDSETGHTQDGAILGTPSYMAPEQADGKIAQLGPAADIYALGAILYECLTGRPPFRAASSLDTLLQVVSEEPVPPARLQPKVPHDLDTICLKCLQKDPAKRYAGAEALADDLHRFLANEPILARPAGKLERIAKWARRNPGVACLSALLLLLMITGFSLVTWQWQVAAQAAEAESQAKDKADQAAEDARQRAAAESLAKQEANKAAQAERVAREEVAKALENSRQVSFTAQIWRANGLIDRDPVRALQALDDPQVCPPDRRDFAWRYYHQLGSRLTRRLAAQEGGIHQAAVTPDGSLLATVTAKGEIRLWNLVTGQSGATLPGHGGTIQALAFSPNGKTLASGGRDGLVKLWEMPDGKLKTTLNWQFKDKALRHVLALSFRPDGRMLAAGGGFFDAQKAEKESDSRWRRPVVWVWDIERGSGKLLATTTQLKAYGIDDSGVNSLAYSADGKTLAVGLTRASSVLLVDVASGEQRQQFRVEPGWIGAIAFNPEGKLLAYGNSTSNVFLCDVASGNVRHALFGHLFHDGHEIGAVLFTPEGALISGGPDGTVHFWEPNTGQLRMTLRCGDLIHHVRLLSGVKKLLVVTAREVQIWSLNHQASLATLRAPPRGQDKATGSSALVFDEEGKRLAVAGQDELVRVWDPATRKARDLAGHKARTLAVAFGPAGSDLLASGGEDSQVLLWRLRGAKMLTPIRAEGHTAAVTCLAVTPDAALVISGSHDGTMRLWDTASGKLVHRFDTGHRQVHSLALSGDGQRLLSSGQGGGLRLWDLPQRRLLATIPAPNKGRTDRLALTRDGRLAATTTAGNVVLHDLDSKDNPRPIATSGASSVAFTPDGKTLAVGGGDRLVRLFDVTSGHLRGELSGHSHQIVALAFNHNATLLATASRGNVRWDHHGEVKLWAAPTPEKAAR